MNFAGVAELADALDLGSSGLSPWGFDSLRPHHGQRRKPLVHPARIGSRHWRNVEHHRYR